MWTTINVSEFMYNRRVMLVRIRWVSV